MASDEHAPATLNLSGEEADVLLSELYGAIEDARELDDEERATVLAEIAEKLRRASQTEVDG